MAKSVSNIGNQKQSKLNIKFREDEKRRKVLQKIADDAALNEKTDAEAKKIIAFQEQQQQIAEDQGRITGQYPDFTGNITGESIAMGKSRLKQGNEGQVGDFVGYDENGDIKMSLRDSTQAQENMDYNLNQQQELGAVVRPADYNLKGLDPALIRQMSAMNLSPGIASGRASAMADPNEDIYAAYPQMAEFAQGMTGETNEDRQQYIDRLIADGYLNIGEEGGVTKKLRKRQTVTGQLGSQDAETYKLVYDHYLKSSGDPTIAKNRAEYWKNKQTEEGQSYPAFLDRNMHTPVSAQEAKSVIGDLYDNSNKLQTMFMNFADPSVGGNPQVAQAFDKWMGEDNAMYRPELMLSMLLAYYRAMEEASWADHSQDEYKSYALYEAVKKEKHPNLWKRDRNRNARTPQRKVLEERIGDYIEEVTRTKFKTPREKSLMGQMLLEAVAQTDFEAHDVWAGQAAPAGMEMNTAKVERYTDKEGYLYKVDGYSYDEALTKFLGDSKGIRDLLQPNYRNHVRVTPKSPEQVRDINATVQGAKVSGVSPIRTNEQNIVEEMGMQLDPAMMNIFNKIYNDTDWHQYWNHKVKFKPQHWHIITQENQWIMQRAKDQKTFYLDSKYRNSARKGTQRLLMADMKPMRAMTISATHADSIILSKGKKRTQEEDLLMLSLSMMLGYDDKVFSFMKNGMERLFEGKTDKAIEARAIGRYFNQLGENQEPSGIAAGITSQRVEAFGLPEGLDTVQALRTLDAYLTAKQNGQNVFLTKFITAVDASQSGQSIQAFQMGNIITAMRGGLRTPDWMPRVGKRNARLDLEKLYEATVGNTREILDGQTMEDPKLNSFIRIMFGASEGGALSDQGGVWSEAKKFAKRAVQGASYGQGPEGAITSVMTELTEWAEDNWTADEMNSRILALETEFGFHNKEAIERAEARGEVLPQRVVTLDEFGGIAMEGNAGKELRKYAEAFVKGMNKADPKILKYSQEMRKVFKTYIKLADFAKQTGTTFEAPHFTYMEPQGISEGDMYDTKKNGKHRPYVPGLKTSMLDTIIPNDWKIMKMGDMMDINGNPVEIFYEDGQAIPDLQTEVNALSQLSEERSTGITRFPVISIHGLDDLIISMAVTELKKISAAEAKKTGKPDAFQFYLSVWDAGRVSPLMIEKFTKAYNKAFIQVMRQNRFYKMLYEQFNDFLTKPDVVAAINKVKQGVGSDNLKADVIAIESSMKKLESLIAKIESGGKEGMASNTGKAKTLMGQNTLDMWADDLGWENAYIPSKDSSNAKAKARKISAAKYVPITPGIRDKKSMIDDNDGYVVASGAKTKQQDGLSEEEKALMDSMFT